MPVDKLIPSVERRLSGWVGVKERLGRSGSGTPGPTITLSRQFGCEAYDLAEQLRTLIEARRGQQWTVFDKALLERVSRETHLSERLLSNLGDESQLFDTLAPLVPGWRTHDEAYEVLARYIVRIASEGHAVLVGQGGAVLTQHLPNCVHFRLEAPVEHRVQSIMKRLDISRGEAEVLVTEHQDRRDRFIERFLHCSMSDTRYYHAVFNTAKSPIESIARSILELVPPAP